MRSSAVYKSPIAALIWSLLLPGFGQLYNRDFIVGFTLLGLELLINLNSNLNLALLHSFHWDINNAHEAVNYKWGMFYPSLYGFAMWQAYNFAKANNHKLQGLGLVKRTYLTGPLAGMVIGMDLGLFWHDLLFIINTPWLQLANYPVFNGLLFGFLGAVLGQTIEKQFYRKNRNINISS